MKKYIIKNDNTLKPSFYREGKNGFSNSWLYEDHHPVSQATKYTKKQAEKKIKELNRIYFGSNIVEL